MTVTTRSFPTRRAIGVFLATALLAVSNAPANAQAGKLPKGDPVRGATLYAQCKICHALEAGKNGLGPSLKGVVGRKPATVAGFTYSAAMQKQTNAWTPQQISEFLTSPVKKVPGTKMAYGGMSKEQDRADIIAYLQKN